MSRATLLRPLSGLFKECGLLPAAFALSCRYRSSRIIRVSRCVPANAFPDTRNPAPDSELCKRIKVSGGKDSTSTVNDNTQMLQRTRLGGDRPPRSTSSGLRNSRTGSKEIIAEDRNSLVGSMSTISAPQVLASETIMMSPKRWSLMFLAAAGFNFAMGRPIFLASAWSYRLAYFGDVHESAVRFWGDFGFAVLLIGVGYWILSRDVTRNRGIVWLGIFAKMFDVAVLSWRWADGLARLIVLLPAAVDGAFCGPVHPLLALRHWSSRP